MHTLMKVPAEVGMMSLIGTGDARPVKHGNYFWLAEPEVRVLNFWAENLKTAKDRFLKDGLVQIRVYKWKNYEDVERTVCIIDDPRIPKDWYPEKLCFTGSWIPSTEIAKEIYDYVGDPGNECEMFTDPELYYARRGGVMGQRCVVYGKDRSKEYCDRLVAAILEKRSK